MIKVEIAALKILTGFTYEEGERIKDDLTLPNPAYISAMKFSGYSSVNIPSQLYYYMEHNDCLCVPRGYTIPFPFKIINDERISVPVDYPLLYVTPRLTQKEALKEFLNNPEKGTIVVPTGGGKSILGLIAAKLLGQRTLIIVQKDDLVSGWRKDAMLSFRLRPKQIGIIKADKFRLGKQITITTIQTLSKLGKDIMDQLHSYFGLLICDEFHRSAAKSYDIISLFPAKYRIGLTATDIRNDGLRNVLTFYYGGVCYRYIDSEENTDIITPKNVLIKVKESNIIYNPPDRYMNKYGKEIFAVRFNGEITNIRDLSKLGIQTLIDEGSLLRKPMDYHKAKKVIMEDAEFNISICRDIMNEYKQGKSCLVFCSEKEHCRIIQKVLIDTFDCPENKIQMYYGDSKEPKEEMKANAESRQKLITIATYAIATEGTNVKAWERIFLAMTIGNKKDTIQAIGRGRRTTEGKNNLIVYDYVHPRIKGIKNHRYIRSAVYDEIGFVREDDDTKIYNTKRR